MLTAAALVPGAPLVVPSVSGPGAADVVDLRTATLEVARRLADTAQQWIAVGVGDPTAAAVGRGTFAGFGIDERVSLQPEGSDSSCPVVRGAESMSTAMLVAGWIRGQVAATATICPTLVAASATAQECHELGTSLGEGIAGTDTAVGLLVIADGSFGLTVGAPGGAIDGAPAEQSRIDAAVARADLEVLSGLDAQRCRDLGIDGRAAWQVAAAIWEAAAPGSPPVISESLYCAAPFGVGYQVAWWSR